MTEEEKSKRLQEMKGQTSFGWNVLPQKEQPRKTPISKEEESESSDSYYSEEERTSEGDFVPPKQGERVNTAKDL